jgi:glyoxylase-like metal-dependent hydrolase (beta-lactamase superfamily II)
MNIHTLPLGAYQTNTYIVENGGHCVIIDAGYHPETILRFLNDHDLTADAILLTHGHFDHVGAVRDLAAELGCPVYLHEKELSMPPMMTAGPLYYTHTYGEGDQLQLAGISFRVLHTPGHTPGSVCLIAANHLFSGDTLFAGSCGRTDLPGGDWATIRKSLTRLAGMENDYLVHPGHGESTTLAREKQYNPYMQ